MVSPKLSKIHAEGSAKLNHVYYDKDGKAYIGVQGGRLKPYTPPENVQALIQNSITAYSNSVPPIPPVTTTGVATVTDDANGVVIVDNTDPLNPIITFAGVNVDGITVTGDGTAGNPLIAPAGSGFTYTIVNVNTTPYTIIPITGVYKYLVDTTVGNITINFPTAVGNTALYTIIKTTADTNSIICDPNGAQTINGNPTQTIKFQNTSITVYSDNANLYIE